MTLRTGTIAAAIVDWRGSDQQLRIAVDGVLLDESSAMISRKLDRPAIHLHHYRNSR